MKHKSSVIHTGLSIIKQSEQMSENFYTVHIF
jgi:hypothetical protein